MVLKADNLEKDICDGGGKHCSITILNNRYIPDPESREPDVVSDLFQGLG